MCDHIEQLLTAAAPGDLESVAASLNAKISVNAKNEIGYTALMAAARSYRTSVVTFLLSRGDDPRLVCKDGMTALHFAVGETPSLPDAQAECVRLLLESGAEVDARTDTGLTPLLNASWFGCTKGFAELLTAGASLDSADEQGRTAEDLAMMKSRTDILRLIADERQKRTERIKPPNNG